MRKTCAQPVLTVWVTAENSPSLPTSKSSENSAEWTNYPLSPLSVHTFCIQLPTGKYAQITDRNGRLYTLSTPPIIRAKQVYKEKNSLGTRG